MREDLTLALRRAGINPDSLNAMQRILLTTDGTVTDILEAYFREPLEVVALAQSIEDTIHAIPELNIAAGCSVLLREIVLRGKLSGRTALHANSVIVLERLSHELREGLLEKKQPIGHLLLNNRLETYREITQCERQAAGSLAPYFAIYATAPLLSRTYTVKLAGQGIMRITERFPEYGI